MSISLQRQGASFQDESGYDTTAGGELCGSARSVASRTLSNVSLLAGTKSKNSSFGSSAGASASIAGRTVPTEGKGDARWPLFAHECLSSKTRTTQRARRRRAKQPASVRGVYSRHDRTHTHRYEPQKHRQTMETGPGGERYSPGMATQPV